MEARAVRGAGGRSGPECYQCFKTPCGCSRRASATNTTSSAAAPSAASTSTTDIAIAKVTTPEVGKEQGAVAGSGPMTPTADDVDAARASATPSNTEPAMQPGLGAGSGQVTPTAHDVGAGLGSGPSVEALSY